VIRLSRLSKRYRLGERHVDALLEVDLAIQAGEHVAIVGTSGSGKSTLMNVLGLLDRWDAGEYALGGREVSTLSDAELARLRNQTLGFVFQSFHLLPSKTAWENVAMPLAHRRMSSRQREQAACAMLERLGLGERVDHRPNELSGGQRQRVAIARALVGDPAVILADEPTGNLDTSATEDVLTILEAARDEGRTVVIVTHEAEVAARARRVVTMRDARILTDERRAA
jgi:putative ABC transport system ATP-binding protein